MPRIFTVSDLHLEYGRTDIDLMRLCQESSPDAIVLAGDIHTSDRVIGWAEHMLPKDIPIAVVPGNHESYDADLEESVAEMVAAAELTPNISVLERGALCLETAGGAIRILGCTLWTDFCALGVENQRKCMDYARGNEKRRGSLDYRLIRYRGELLTPEVSVDLHQRDKAWLTERLQEPFPGKTVVATHFAPTTKSANPNYPENEASCLFVSNLDDLISEYQPELVIHGHVHWPVDTSIGFTRVVSRPIGYPGQSMPRLNLTPIEI